MAASLAVQSGPARRPRRDRFSGIHFDLHPKAIDHQLGREISFGHIHHCLHEVHVDFVQFVFKADTGRQGYPSLVRRSARGFVKDSLAFWPEVTAQVGARRFFHFSGAWDSFTLEYHPSWTRLKRDNSRDDRQTSLWCSYGQHRMIP